MQEQMSKKLPPLVLSAAMGAFAACGPPVSGDPEVDSERIGDVLAEVESFRRFGSDGKVVKTEGDWIVARVWNGRDSTGARIGGFEQARRLDADTDHAYIRSLARDSGLDEIETDILLERLRSARDARNAEAHEEEASR